MTVYTRDGDIDTRCVCYEHGLVYSMLPTGKYGRVRACPFGADADYEISYQSIMDYSHLGSATFCHIFDAMWHAQDRRSREGHLFRATLCHVPTRKTIGYMSHTDVRVMLCSKVG
jgi:ethanolamine utilization protein EutP (predicted NTPase)